MWRNFFFQCVDLGTFGVLFLTGLVIFVLGKQTIAVLEHGQRRLNLPRGVGLTGDRPLWPRPGLTSRDTRIASTEGRCPRCERAEELARTT